MAGTVRKNLGMVTAYAYAVSKGYSGTEEEFAELMASYADVAQDAEASAQAAAQSVTTAEQKATQAAGSATNAAVSATSALESAQAAAGSSNSANLYAQNASASATNAAGSASSASTYAGNASTSAQSAEGSANAAQTSATQATGSATTATAKAGEAATSATTAVEAAQRAEDAASTLVIDDTLTHAGQAADAKKTGDEIGELKENLKNALNLNVTWIDGGYINDSGTISSNNAFEYTDFIEIPDVFFKIGFTLYLASNLFVAAMYDADKLYIANSGVNGAGNNIPKSGFVAYPSENDELHIPKYVRFSHCKHSAGITNPEPIIYLADVAKPVLTDDVISSSKLKEKSVTKEKCAFIVHNPESNYIDKTKYRNGYIKASGAFVENNGWRATDYCELLPNTLYYGSGLHGGYCAFYKSDKTVISAYGANSFTISSFTTPAETAYGRFSLNASSQSVDTAWIFTQNEKPKDYVYVLDDVGVYTDDDSNPCDYIGNEISVFNKILCVGDSMTEGTFNHLDSGSTQYINIPKYAYPQYLHAITGVEVTNLGHGGKTSVQWYDMEKNNDLSGYDCAIIQLGINDCSTYGGLVDASKTAFQNIITKLKNENNNIKIFVANIIPAASYSSNDYKQFSTDLLTWLQTTYANDRNVIPLDIQRYGHTGDNFAYNCGHLSALGYHRLAEDYKNYISWYIANNKDVFREVQFIGTDYWYANPNS